MDKNLINKQLFIKKLFRKKYKLFLLNCLAILILSAWLGYRRQWNLLITFTLIIIMSVLIEAIFDFTVPFQGFAAGTAVIGFMGNSILHHTSNGTYHKLIKKGLTEDEIISVMSDQAAPSVLFSIVGTLCCLVSIIMFSILADTLFGFNIT